MDRKFWKEKLMKDLITLEEQGKDTLKFVSSLCHREIGGTTEKKQEAVSLKWRGHILFSCVELDMYVIDMDIFNTVEILVCCENLNWRGIWEAPKWRGMMDFREKR